MTTSTVCNVPADESSEFKKSGVGRRTLRSQLLNKIKTWLVRGVVLFAIWQNFLSGNANDSGGIKQLNTSTSLEKQGGTVPSTLVSIWVNEAACVKRRSSLALNEKRRMLRDSRWILFNVTRLGENRELLNNWLSPAAQSWLTNSCPDVVAHHKRVPYFRQLDDDTLHPIVDAQYAAMGVCMLKHLNDELERQGLQFILVVGTAIGAHRHHGVIPWDDDLDIAAPLSQIEAFIAVLESLSAADGFRWKQMNPQKIKMWHVLTPHVTNPHPIFEWNAPCVDVYFYKDQENEAPWFYKGDWYPTHYLRNTQRLYFGGAWLPAPVRSLETLSVTYDDLVYCVDKGYNHRHETTPLSNPYFMTIDCCYVAERIPFVFRERHLWNSTEPYRGVTEELRVGNTAIHKVVYDENGVGTVVPYPITA
eukprot:comp24232_c5_seq2/m.44708 comp24232_c5_seq2/g.44708  ORF comp24232_c5_seq2/g.44708 comp24232_c5_seq2/m.44708 type:complete len:419 (-) comp24232_c5_seq2:509-1765(-)